VLRLLPTSIYLQMAAVHYVSRSTIKTCLRPIYQKLGVASRAEAIERAVNLRLLPIHGPSKYTGNPLRG